MQSAAHYEYLQLALKEDSSFADIREAILAHERVTKGFSSESILKQIQAPSGDPDTFQRPSKWIESSKVVAKIRKAKERKEIIKAKDVVLLVVCHGVLDVAKEKENIREESPKARKDLERKVVGNQKAKTKDRQVVLQKGAGYVVTRGISRKSAPIVDKS